MIQIAPDGKPELLIINQRGCIPRVRRPVTMQFSKISLLKRINKNTRNKRSVPAK